MGAALFLWVLFGSIGTTEGGDSLLQQIVPHAPIASLFVAAVASVIPERRQALGHHNRRAIYDHLLVLPGDHLRSIARQVELSLGAVGHHLRILLKDGFVHEEHVGSHRRFYPIGQGSESHRNELFRQHWKYRDLRLRVLLAVCRLREARAIDVARALSISRQLAAYHLVRLLESGLLRKEGVHYRA